MEEKETSKMEKVSGFFGSLMNKIVNLVIFIIIIGLIAVIGWFFYDKKMSEKDMEFLKKEKENLEQRLKEAEISKDVEVKEEEVKNSKNVEIVESSNSIRENEIQNDVKNSNQENNRSVLKGDYYCEKDSDCVVKSLNNCCGYNPVCANKNANFEKINKETEENCSKEGLASDCSFEDINSCKCENNKCKSI